MGCVAHACTALRQRVFGQAAANFGRAAANSPPFVAIAAQCAASTHRCYQRSIRDGRCRSMRVALRSTQKGFPPSVGLPQSALLCRPRGRRCLQGPPAWREEEEEAEAGGGCCYSGRLCGRLRLRGGQRGQRPGGQAGARGPARCTATRQRRRRRGARAAWVWRRWEHLRAASGLLGIFGGRAGRGRSMGDRRMAGGAAAAAPVSSCQGAPRADGRVQQTSLPAALARATGRPAHDTPPLPPSPLSASASLLQACAEVEVFPQAGPIRLADVQNLLLWVLGEGTNPRWCFVKVRRRLDSLLATALRNGRLACMGNERMQGRMPAAACPFQSPVEPASLHARERRRGMCRPHKQRNGRSVCRCKLTTSRAPSPPPQTRRSEQTIGQAGAAACGARRGQGDVGGGGCGRHAASMALPPGAACGAAGSQRHAGARSAHQQTAQWAHVTTHVEPYCGLGALRCAICRATGPPACLAALSAPLFRAS